MSDFNLLLHRPVADGAQFKKLIPASTCRVHFTGDGDTGYSVKQMANMIETYHGQMDKVAKKLKQRSLQSTCTAIHDFAYRHFQYKADKATQYLRSPACSWSVRHEGIDCKSYSIIAGSLLACLGINFYIRRIKQQGFEPHLWTHVYIVVPACQKTNSLKKGYYVIDGTLPTQYEPEFLQKDDYFMQHVGLAAPAQQGLNAISLNSLKKLKLSDVSDIIASLACVGATTYDKKELDRNLEIMNAYFNDKVVQINSAAMLGNMQMLSDVVADFKGVSLLIRESFRQYKIGKTGGWGACTNLRLDASMKIADFFHTTCGQALDAWLAQHFTVTPAGTKTYENPKEKSKSIHTTMGLDHTWTSAGKIVQVNKSNYTPKGGAITAFEITDYVIDKAKSGGFNPMQFLGTLTKTLATVSSGSTSGGGGTAPDGSYTDETGTLVEYNNQKTKAAGFGIIGWVLLLGGLTYAVTKFAKMPNKGAGAKKDTN